MGECEMNTIKLSDGTILEEGRKYRWCGVQDNLYNNYRWFWTKCKITRISEDRVISIYDYDDNKEYDHTDESLQKIEAKFMRNNVRNLKKIIFDRW